jgi:hypothetical protein
MHTRTLLPSLLALVAVICAEARAQHAPAAPDPIAACREAHGTDPAGHIACLERALQQRQNANMPETIQSRPVSAPRPVNASNAAPSVPPEFRAQPSRREVESIRVRIVRITYDNRGLGRFVTDQGQVWRETISSPERARLSPDRDYDALIERGVVGGFRMTVEGIRRELKVEPVS